MEEQVENDGKGKLKKVFTLSSPSNKAQPNHYTGRPSKLSQFVSNELHYTTVIDVLPSLSLKKKKKGETGNQKCFAQD